MFRNSSIAEVVETGFALQAVDFVDNSGATATSDVFVCKRGGAGGKTIATVTIVYTDSTKSTILTVTRAPAFPI